MKPGDGFLIKTAAPDHFLDRRHPHSGSEFTACGSGKEDYYYLWLPLKEVKRNRQATFIIDAYCFRGYSGSRHHAAANNREPVTGVK